MIDINISDLLMFQLPFLLILVICLRLFAKKNIAYIAFSSLFFIYSLYVLKFTLLPIPIRGYLEVVRNGTILQFNYEPLWLSETFLFPLKEQILNICLFAPLGYLSNYLFNLTLKKVVLLGLFVSVCIEFIQLLLSISMSYPYRVVDINDVIFNFTGTLIGYFVYRVFSRMYIASVNKLNVKIGPVGQFIYDRGK
ncbi:VanZ family protein [Paenibacillus gorillae]|uniref:VanZ family protein n=1 Tax=Paenibacillus gorillae TaxID=1243662 RepID=UPI0005A8252A|nr:VanZ family protein [Paenibacillus gorillae]